LSRSLEFEFPLHSPDVNQVRSMRGEGVAGEVAMSERAVGKLMQQNTEDSGSNMKRFIFCYNLIGLCVK